jgi:transposase InsO family protein
LGLPSPLGLPALRGADAGEEETDSAPDTRASSADPAQPVAEGEADTGRESTQPTKPHEWWGIEMTTVLVTGFGWIDIVVVLDWYTKKIVGYYAGVPCTAKHWLAALDMAVHQQFPEGA